MEFNQFIDKNKERYLDLFAELISKKSINPPGDEHLVADVIARFLDSIGVEYSIHSHDKRRPSIIAKIGGIQGRRIMLLSHMDVVPAGGGWKTDPFKLTREGNLLYGRGVSDNKGPLLSILIALDYIHTTGEKLDGQFIAVFTADEERGGKFGLKFLLDKDLIKTDCAIVADTPGEMKRIMIAERGSIKLKAIAKGVQWHSAYTHKGGVNAISSMAKFLTKLKDFNLTYEKHELLAAPALSPVSIKGGVAPNVVPDRCECEINIRYLPSQTVDRIIFELATLTKDCGEFEFELLSATKPSEVSGDLEIISIIKSQAKHRGYEAEIAGMNAGTDCKMLVHQGIPAVGYSFTSEGVAHKANEHIDQMKLFEFSGILTGIVKEFLGAGKQT